MNDLFFVMSVVLGMLMVLPLYRLVAGPTVFDRLTGLALISTKTVVLLILLGLIQKRKGLYIDMALVYALIGFVTTLVLAKYFEKGGGSQR